MVIVKQKSSYVKNLRIVSHDIYDYLEETKGTPLYISVLKRKPKLIVSQGFFYYTNGDIVDNTNLYILYKGFLDRCKDLKITIICEYDSLDSNDPEKNNFRIVDFINESFSLSYKNMYEIVFSMIGSIQTVKMGVLVKVGSTFPIEAITNILKFQIEKEKAESFIVRAETAKDIVKTMSIDSFHYKPTVKFANGKVKVTFMLNEKPII